jgi:small conductance mechanosensitive channel
MEDVKTMINDSNLYIHDYLIPAAIKIGWAIGLWIVGGILIRMIVKYSREGLARQKIDPTLVNYTVSALTIALRILLVLAILDKVGVQTTSFAAFIAAAGIAIGAAWAGLLSNLAAGIFIVVLRPYKVGDYITAGGVSGTVREISIFTTTLETFDLVHIHVGNTKIFSDNIQNFTYGEIRRVDLSALIHSSVNPEEAARTISQEVYKIPQVLRQPAVDFAVEKLTEAGYVFNVRLFCKTPDYWTVHAAGNHAILVALNGAKWPTAAPTRYNLQKDWQ